MYDVNHANLGMINTSFERRVKMIEIREQLNRCIISEVGRVDRVGFQFAKAMILDHFILGVIDDSDLAINRLKQDH